MITKYRTGSAAAHIVRIEVRRETESSVFLPVGSGERRQAKVSDYTRYHDSWEEAHAYLMCKAQLQVDGARRRLQYARDQLGNVKGMKKPEGAS